MNEHGFGMIGRDDSAEIDPNDVRNRVGAASRGHHNRGDRATAVIPKSLNSGLGRLSHGWRRDALVPQRAGLPECSPLSNCTAKATTSISAFCRR